MELSFITLWLNREFFYFDYNILKFWHEFASATHGALTPIFKFISLLAEYGIFLILLSVIFMFFKKTKKLGLCTFISIIFGAMITNILLKNLVLRQRPFQNVYHEWWLYVGSTKALGTSFPSGHVTATTAFITALCLNTKKRYGIIGVIFIILMGCSRNYLMVHYPTDVVGGIIFGMISGFLAKKTVEKLQENRMTKTIKRRRYNE